jgi:hypothetical protein
MAWHNESNNSMSNTKQAHLHRPSDKSMAVVTAKAARADKRDAAYKRLMLPGLVQERQREFDARMARLALPASQGYICNASAIGTYRTGDGEVLQAPRPGSLHAYTLPSRGDRT